MLSMVIAWIRIDNAMLVKDRHVNGTLFIKLTKWYQFSHSIYVNNKTVGYLSL